MLGLIIALVVTISSIWVYLDATKNRIGKQEDAKGFFNLSAGGWATVTLLLWIVGLPCYLAKREDLIWRAKRSPVVVSGRTWKALILLAFGTYLVGGQMLSFLFALEEPNGRSALNANRKPVDADQSNSSTVAAGLPQQTFTMTEADAQKCRNLFETHIRVAQAQARYLGEERATKQALQRIEKSASVECMHYASTHFQ